MFLSSIEIGKILLLMIVMKWFLYIVVFYYEIVWFFLGNRENLEISMLECGLYILNE